MMAAGAGCGAQRDQRAGASLAPCERAFEFRRRGSPLWIARRRWIEGWALARQDDPPRAPPRPAAPFDLPFWRRWRWRRSAAGPRGAETISGALVKAYLTNPDINSQRATVRQTDEGVPAANAGYLPTISAVGSIGAEHTNGNQIIPGQAPINYAVGPYPRSVGIQAQENVFDGYRTINKIRSAESQVLAARETLRNTEQTTLLSGVQAYMDVLQNSAIVDLDRNNVDVLKEQLRETRDRFTVGEVTRTDVAQAEASLASANAQLLQDQAVLEASVATYRQVIGDEPKTLAPVKPLLRPIPRTLPEAVNISQVEHPAIVAQEHGVDAAMLSIKIAEGALYPQANVQASLTDAWDVSSTPGMRAFDAKIIGKSDHPDLSGRRGIRGCPPVEGRSGRPGAESQLDQGPDPAERRCVLGP